MSGARLSWFKLAIIAMMIPYVYPAATCSPGDGKCMQHLATRAFDSGDLLSRLLALATQFLGGSENGSTTKASPSNLITQGLSSVIAPNSGAVPGSSSPDCPYGSQSSSSSGGSDTSSRPTRPSTGPNSSGPNTGPITSDPSTGTNTTGHSSGPNAGDSSESNSGHDSDASSSSAESSSVGGASGSESEQYTQLHNEFRKAHGAGPLEWDEELAGKAKQWASRCVFQHSQGQLGSYGENLAMGGGLGPAQVVKMWTSEESAYSDANPSFSMSTGHFTQVVWKSTKKLGCGAADCSQGKLVVCEYSPPGNFAGRFRENVQKN